MGPKNRLLALWGVSAMPKLSLELGLAIVGLVLTVILVVLDKAGKLRGRALLWLLLIAALMTVPLALGNPLVAEVSGAWKWWVRGAMVALVGISYLAIGRWISAPRAPEATATSEPFAMSGEARQSNTQTTVGDDVIHLHTGQPVHIAIAKIPVGTKPGTRFGPFKIELHGPRALGLKASTFLTSSAILEFVVRREKGAPRYPSSDDTATWSKKQAVLRAYDSETLRQFRDSLGKQAIAAHDNLLRKGLQDPALDRLYDDPGNTAGIKVVGQKLHDLAEMLPPDG